MADTKISALPASTTPLAGTEVLPIVQGGVTKQVSVANLTAGRAISATELTLSTGNLIIGTAGKGIDFSADPSASGMTSELLDDYEEGTWTPGVSFGGASVGITYGTAQGFYTRVGNIVHVTCYLTLTSKGSSTGAARVTGLPFNVNAGAAAYAPPALWIDAITYTGTPSGYANAGSGNIDMFQTTEAGAVSALTNANFTGSSRIMLNATYRAV